MAKDRPHTLNLANRVRETLKHPKHKKEGAGQQGVQRIRRVQRNGYAGRAERMRNGKMRGLCGQAFIKNTASNCRAMRHYDTPGHDVAIKI